MSRVLFRLINGRERARAAQFLANAPEGSLVEFKRDRRTVDQNALMWALLTDIASQLTWHGQKYTAEDWKDYAMHALKRARWMPSEDGGMVPIGMRTSELTKAEMSELVEFLYAFGASHDVRFHDAEDPGAASAVPGRERVA